VELFVQALTVIRHEVDGLIVGFGSGREPLAAMVSAFGRGDREAVAWLGATFGLTVDPGAVAAPGRTATPVSFTGMLDHRYVPGVLAAMDVQVVPSILPEAFGIVVAEGAAAGALPMVARHSGLAEVSGALEDAIGRAGLFSFDPGARAVTHLAEGIDRLLSLHPAERDELRRAVSAFVAEHWTWARTAASLLAAAG
jgi:glycosyltransferase involved in cell wall biosynthesis